MTLETAYWLLILDCLKFIRYIIVHVNVHKKLSKYRSVTVPTCTWIACTGSGKHIQTQVPIHMYESTSLGQGSPHLGSAIDLWWCYNYSINRKAVLFTACEWMDMNPREAPWPMYSVAKNNHFDLQNLHCIPAGSSYKRMYLCPSLFL